MKTRNGDKLILLNLHGVRIVSIGFRLWHLLQETGEAEKNSEKDTRTNSKQPLEINAQERSALPDINDKLLGCSINPDGVVLALGPRVAACGKGKFKPDNTKRP
jgi:hypothetical protein